MKINGSAISSLIHKINSSRNSNWERSRKIHQLVQILRQGSKLHQWDSKHTSCQSRCNYVKGCSSLEFLGLCMTSTRHTQINLILPQPFRILNLAFRQFPDSSAMLQRSPDILTCKTPDTIMIISYKIFVLIRLVTLHVVRLSDADDVKCHYRNNRYIQQCSP